MAPSRIVPIAAAIGLVAVVAVFLFMRGGHRGGAPVVNAPLAAADAGASAATGDAGPVLYDPTVLLDNGVPAGEVYVKEPRSDAWAEQAEAVIGGAMKADLDKMIPEAHMAMKCKTLSCAVGIDAPEDKRAAALAVTKFVFLAPWVVDIEPEADGTVRWMFFSERRMADGKTFTDWYLRIRKRALEDIRTGKRPNPFPVALDQLPAE